MFSVFDVTHSEQRKFRDGVFTGIIDLTNRFLMKFGRVQGFARQRNAPIFPLSNCSTLACINVSVHQQGQMTTTSTALSQRSLTSDCSNYLARPAAIGTMSDVRRGFNGGFFTEIAIVVELVLLLFIVVLFHNGTCSMLYVPKRGLCSLAPTEQPAGCAAARCTTRCGRPHDTSLQSLSTT